MNGVCFFTFVQYCGDTIAGLSLLSDSVMRMVRTTNPHPPYSKEVDRHRPEINLQDNFYANILLPRRSLYIMK